MIDQIPQSVLACLLYKKGTKIEVSVTGISEKLVRIRLSHENLEIFGQILSGKRSEALEQICLQFRYFDLLAYGFLDLMITKFQVVSIEEKEYYGEVILAIDEKKNEFQNMVQFVTSQYISFVRAKQDPFGETSKKICEYPFQDDFEMSDSFEDAMKDAKDFVTLKNIFHEAKESGLEVAISFTKHSWYQRLIAALDPLASYISESKDVFDTCFEEKSHKTFWKECFFAADRIYLGNQFCLWLCPNLSQWKQLVMLCRKYEKKMTVMLPPVSEENREKVDEMVDLLKTICERGTELVLNDWGSVERYGDSGFKLLAGILLLKARKDPRAKYRNGFFTYQNAYETPQAATKIAGQFMEQMHIAGVESDVCFKKEHGLSVSFHFPLYQTNTSSFCTLRGLVMENDRGKQYPVTFCKGLCERYFLAYPKHLGMIGIGNSLFGIRDMEGDLVKKCCLAGVERIVYNGI